MNICYHYIGGITNHLEGSIKPYLCVLKRNLEVDSEDWESSFDFAIS